MAIPKKWLKGYEDHDDIDSIVREMRDNAVYKATIPELVRMLEHPALFEERRFGDIVFAPKLISRVVAEHGVEAVLAHLHRWYRQQSGGPAQRALYTIVLLSGVGPEAIAAVESGNPGMEVAALCGVMDRTVGKTSAGMRFAESLREPLAVLLDRGIGTDHPFAEDSAELHFEGIFDRALVFACALAGGEPLLSQINEDPWLRSHLVALVQAKRFPEKVVRPEKVRRVPKEEAQAAIRELEQALAVEQVPSNHTVLREVIRQPYAREFADPLVRAAISYCWFASGIRVPASLAGDFATCCVDLLDSSASSTRVSAAELLLSDNRHGYVLAGAAWARLDSANAARISRNFGGGTHGALRWDAAAEGFLTYDDVDPDVAELLRERFTKSGPTPALQAVIDTLPVDLEAIGALIRRARNTDEMNAALSVAVDAKANVLLRPTLVRLRSSRFQVDATMVAHLCGLVDDDNEMWLQAEVDGENPMRDRRAALAQALPA